MTMNKAEFTRRTVLQSLIGSAALATPVMAQSNKDDLVKRAGKTLTFAGSGGDLGEILKTLLADFTADTGIKVNFFAGPLLDIYGRIRAERNRPSIDVYFSSSVSEAQGLKDDMYTPLDPAIVTNLAEVYDLARVPGDKGVRMEFTDLGIVYNKKKLAENGVTLQKWDDIWSPALRERIILGDTTSFYTVLYIAYMTQRLGDKVSDPTKGIAYIAHNKPNLLAIVRTYPERIQMLTSGAAWLTIDVGMTSLPETKNHADIGFLSPPEGSPLFWNSLHAIRNCPNPIGAQLLINHLISTPVQTRWAEKSLVGPVNKNVKLPPEIAALVPYGPERIAKLVVLDPAMIADSIDRYRTAWDSAMR